MHKLVFVTRDKVKVFYSNTAKAEIWELEWSEGSEVCLVNGERVRSYRLKGKIGKRAYRAVVEDEVEGGE